MISSADFTKNDIYLKYFNSNSLENEIVSSMDRIPNPVRILTNPCINEALESIVNTHKTSDNRESTILNSNKSGTPFEPPKPKLFQEGGVTDYEDLDTVIEHDDTSIVSNSNVSMSSNDTNISQEQYFDRSFKLVNTKEEIAKLTISIDQIFQELELLKHLTLKAELTNNQSQLMLLKKSERSLTRDLKGRELLKQQYLVQENVNSLFGKTQICIPSYFIDNHTLNLREIAYYIINVRHKYNDQVTTWEIPRRYNEFFMLHCYLKKNYKSLMKNLDEENDIFPAKVNMSLKYHISSTFLYEERKKMLESYLKLLLDISEICRDDIFRMFLTSSAPFAVRMNSENVTLMHGHQSSSSSSSINSVNSRLGSKSREKRKSYLDETETREADNVTEANYAISDDNGQLHSTKGATFMSGRKSIIKPVCDLFMSIFRLDRSNSNWLRGRAILTVLQQLLGDTIEKHIKKTLAKLQSENQVHDILISLKDSLWGPNGSFERKRKHGLEPPRTEGEKARTSADSQIIIQQLFTELCGKVVGLRTSQEAAVRLHGLLQNKYLTSSLLLELFDVILTEIFFDSPAEIVPSKL